MTRRAFGQEAAGNAKGESDVARSDNAPPAQGSVSPAGEAVRARERFLVFGAPAIEDAEIAEVVASLKSGWLGTGPKVARFERDFAAYKGAHHPVAVSSCSAALHLSLLAAGIGPGDEVITTALTFCATVNAIIHAGATPVLADVEGSTMNLDPRAVEAKLTPRTRAILPVHFAGRPCAMDALMALARQHRLAVIEDCAHAIEAGYHGQPVGTFGDFGCFSFYVTKNIVAGEGGMVLARRAEDAAAIRVLALHGMSQDAWKRFNDEGYTHYDIEAAGFKYNMTDLQAAIVLHQLPRIDRYAERRRALWRRYDEAFADLPLVTPAPPEADTQHARHLYTILVDEGAAGIGRDAFVAAMAEQHIGVGVHYRCLAEYDYYRRRYGWRPEDFPEAMRIGRQTISLPLSAKLGEDDAADVIRAVRRIVEGAGARTPGSMSAVRGAAASAPVGGGA